MPFGVSGAVRTDGHPLTVSCHLHSQAWRLLEGGGQAQTWGILRPSPSVASTIPSLLIFLGSLGMVRVGGLKVLVTGSWSGSLTEASGCWCQ